MGMMAAIFGSAIAAMATPLLIALLSRMLRRAKPYYLEGSAGSLSPDRISAAFTVAVGALFVIGAVATWMVGGIPLFAAGVCVAVGLPIGGFMVPSLTHVHDVSWNLEGIKGPSTRFGPTLGLARAEISWSNLKGSGTTTTGYWFVEATDGRRIYWSYLYRGYDVLTSALKTHRPDLALPPEMT